jgi:hypothetical protein
MSENLFGLDGKALSVARAAQVGEFKGTLGRRTVVNSLGQVPNLQVQATQLISARFDAPRQFIVTVAPAARADADVLPWSSINIDGGAPTGFPQTPNNFNAPVVDVLAAFGNSLRLEMRWGAAGAAWVTQFDYPLAGGAFGVTADMLDLNVATTGTANIATLGQLPVVGAFMCAGAPAHPQPMRWREIPNQLTASGGATPARVWAVKPYARQLSIASFNCQSGVRVDFMSASLVNTFQTYRFGQASPIGFLQVVDVPANAAIVKVTNLDATNVCDVSLDWLIGFV